MVVKAKKMKRFVLPWNKLPKLTETGHDVILRLYEGMRHEILNETGKEAVWKDVLAFVRQSASL